MRKQRAFTVVELVAVLVVLTLSAVLILAILSRAYGQGGPTTAPERRMQVECQKNLSNIAKALALYSALSNDQFPWPLLVAKGDPNATVNEKTVAKKPFDSALGTCAMQNIWWLVDQEMVGEAAFHCPADGGWTKREAKEKYGWTLPTQFSYGMHFPYDQDAKGNDNPARLSDSNADSSLVVMADRNPGGSVGEKNPPSNHPTEGEACARRDTSVFFYSRTKDSKAGIDVDLEYDDIYVNNAGVAGGVPTDTKDKKGSGGRDTSICLTARDTKATSQTKPAQK